MRAVVKTAHAPESIELREVKRPAIGAQEVLIKVAAAGVCGTDLGIYRDRPGQLYYPPVVLGHEFSGTIEETGTEVGDWKPGDRVVAEPQSRACGSCYYCRQGRIGMCPHKRSPGWGTDGGMAEYVLMPARLLHRIPEGLDFDTAALAEPLAVNVHAMTENTSMEPGDVVVVMGAGPIGVLAALLAMECGARAVLLAGASRDERFRLPAARALGIPMVANAERDDIVRIASELSEGIGVDMVVDACGAESAINLGVDMLRKGGKLVATGIASGPVRFNWNSAVVKNVGCFFQYSSSYVSWRRSLHLLASRRALFSRVVSARYSLDRWREAFERSEAGLVIKALLHPADPD